MLRGVAKHTSAPLHHRPGGPISLRRSVTKWSQPFFPFLRTTRNQTTAAATVHASGNTSVLANPRRRGDSQRSRRRGRGPRRAAPTTVDIPLEAI